MSDPIGRAAATLAGHAYTTGGGPNPNGINGPLVCECGHRERPGEREALQRVHLRHLLVTLGTAGLLVTPAHDAAVAAKALREAAESAAAEDGREWPFDGLDEMQRWLRERADRIDAESKEKP